MSVRQEKLRNQDWTWEAEEQPEREATRTSRTSKWMPAELVPRSPKVTSQPDFPHAATLVLGRSVTNGLTVEDALNGAFVADRVGAGIKRPAVVPARPRQDRFVALQSWEGTVIKVENGTFWARLLDQTGAKPEEEAEFYIEDLSPSDEELLTEGAVFYWSVGYRDRVSGQRERTSILRFRRLPMWNSKEVSAAKERAARAAKLFSS